MLSALARVRAPVVVPFALLLQGEPPWDVVQLGGVRQVNEDLGKHTQQFNECVYTHKSMHQFAKVNVSQCERGLPLLGSH